jgi:hypothetical protein
VAGVSAALRYSRYITFSRGAKMEESLSYVEEQGLVQAPEWPGRDLFTVAKFWVPIDAHILRGFLVAADIPAVLADDLLVQADGLLTPALGGVRLLVPEAHLPRARAMLREWARGDYALSDDADVGPAAEP